MFAWTLTLQGIRLDLKNDFTLELGSVQPNGGNSGGPLSACLAQLLSHEPGLLHSSRRCPTPQAHAARGPVAEGTAPMPTGLLQQCPPLSPQEVTWSSGAARRP